jgi:hypothetical protein
MYAVAYSLFITTFISYVPNSHRYVTAGGGDLANALVVLLHHMEIHSYSVWSSSRLEYCTVNRRLPSHSVSIVILCLHLYNAEQPLTSALPVALLSPIMLHRYLTRVYISLMSAWHCGLVFWLLLKCGFILQYTLELSANNVFWLSSSTRIRVTLILIVTVIIFNYLFAYVIAQFPKGQLKG